MKPIGVLTRLRRNKSEWKQMQISAINKNSEENLSLWFFQKRLHLVRILSLLSRENVAQILLSLAAKILMT